MIYSKVHWTSKHVFSSVSGDGWGTEASVDSHFPRALFFVVTLRCMGHAQRPMITLGRVSRVDYGWRLVKGLGRDDLQLNMAVGRYRLEMTKSSWKKCPTSLSHFEPFSFLGRSLWSPGINPPRPSARLSFRSRGSGQHPRTPTTFIPQTQLTSLSTCLRPRSVAKIRLRGKNSAFSRNRTEVLTTPMASVGSFNHRARQATILLFIETSNIR